MSVVDVAEIYAQYHKKVMGYIRARVRSYADAEDLCSDVFEKVQKRIDGYDPEKAALGTWIYAITRNCVIDFFRRSRPQDELDEGLASDDAVDDGLLKDETLEELARALEELPEHQRQIVVLRYYEQKPLTEIARIMNLSYGAVKLRHADALERLRRNMQAAA